MINASPPTARRCAMILAIVVMALAATDVTIPAVNADPLPPGWRPPASNLQPSVTNLRVTDVGGTTARVSFETPRETVPCFHITVAPSASKRPGPNSGPTSTDGIGTSVQSADPGCDTETKRYRTSHNKVFTRLTSNTTYLVQVSATTAGGESYTGELRFMTHKKRIKVSLKQIYVSDDGDFFGKGEPIWVFRVLWEGGGVFDCYPLDCSEGSTSEGTIFPRNADGQRPAFILAEENFATLPRSLRLVAQGFEKDTVNIPLPCGIPPPCDPSWSGSQPSIWAVPQGAENAAEELRLHVVTTSSAFDSAATLVLEVFHDDRTYTPNVRHPGVYSTWR